MSQKIQIAGRYQLQKRLGSGTFGEVWRAADTKFSLRPVALKLLKPEFEGQPDVVGRFLIEADALSAVQHPNVVTVYDRGLSEGHHYLALEYVEGPNLRDWLAGRSQINQAADVALARTIFEQLCAGVAAAHELRVPGPILHRDLKPANVLLRQTAVEAPLVKVVDFGIAQLGARNITRTGAVMGSLFYMAPEQGTGNVANIGPWTDVFSLGVILLELRTGASRLEPKRPLWARSIDREFDASELGGLGELLPGEVEVLLRCLRREPAERFPEARALLSAFRAAWDAGLAQATMRDFPSIHDEAATAPAPIAPVAPLALLPTGIDATRPLSSPVVPLEPYVPPPPPRALGALLALGAQATLTLLVAVTAVSRAHLAVTGARDAAGFVVNLGLLIALGVTALGVARGWRPAHRIAAMLDVILSAVLVAAAGGEGAAWLLALLPLAAAALAWATAPTRAAASR